MRDVAEHAGVSKATVSHVINETRFVEHATKVRVQEAIRTLGLSTERGSAQLDHPAHPHHRSDRLRCYQYFFRRDHARHRRCLDRQQL